jgi:hypothetical protein
MHFDSARGIGVFKWKQRFTTSESQDKTLDPVLRALPDCPHLREVVIKTQCAGTDDSRHLLGLTNAHELASTTEESKAVVQTTKQRRESEMEKHDPPRTTLISMTF